MCIFQHEVEDNTCKDIDVHEIVCLYDFFYLQDHEASKKIVSKYPEGP